MAFERDKKDKLTNLGIGQKAPIKAWLDEYKIENYIINDDLTIDVNGSVNISDMWIEEFPSYIRFGIVTGDFDSNNNELISLIGCPRTIGGDFHYCLNTGVSLDGFPQSIGGNFYCCHCMVPDSEIIKVSKLNVVKGKIFWHEIEELSESWKSKQLF